MSVYRYDKSELKSPIRADNGYLHCEGKITRVGVFPYGLKNGTVRRELRLPEEVFNRDSMDSFDAVPLTNGHPPEQLNSKNTRKYQTGTVSKTRSDDGVFLVSNIKVTDENAIADVDGGKSELSCGYKCDLEFNPGITKGIPGIADGLRYDAIQRNIRGNHVAFLSRGRAGREAAIKLDGEDAIFVDETKPGVEPQNMESNKMQKITIDGVDFEVSPQAAQAIGKLQGRADEAKEKADSLEAEGVQAQIKLDEAEEKLKEAQELAEKNDAEGPEEIQKAVRKRLDMERSVRDLIGEKKADEAKLDAMSNDDVMKVAILHVFPKAEEKLDGCDEPYLKGRFDSALEATPAKAEPTNPGLAAVRGFGNTRVDASDDRFDATAARARMVEHNKNLGTQPLAGQVKG